MPTISRRLALAGRADPVDLKSPSLPGASPGSPTGVWLIGNSRPVRLKIEQPWECKSPHADQPSLCELRLGRPFWNVNRTSEPGLFAKQWAPGKGSVVRAHGIPVFADGRQCARSSKRADDGYFSFVKTIGRPPRFRIIWFFAASNSKVTFPLKS